MSGAGDFPAGDGAAGYDPVAEPTAPRNVTAPRALLFQLNGFDFPLDENGLYAEADPVDSFVQLNVGIVLGAIGTSPEAGNRLRRITHVGAPSTQREVEDAIRGRLAERVTAGDVRIDAINYEARPFGGFKVELSYTNLRAQAERARRLSVAT